MKRILTFLIALVAVVGLSSCFTTPTQPTEPSQSTDPNGEVQLTDITLTVEQAEVNVAWGSSYRVLDGVKAVGNDGISYALKVTATCETAAITDGKLDTKVSGTHVIQLVLDYQGIHKTATKTVIVAEKPDTTGNLLANPTVDADYTGWEKYDADSVVTWETEEINGTSFMKCVQTSVSGNSYSPRLHNNGGNVVHFYSGTAYKITFDAKASVNKTIQCQVGQLIGGAPYYYDFGGQVFPFALTTELQSYSITFLMKDPDPAADASQGSVTFEMGTVSGDSTVATVWIGNFCVEEFTGEIVDEVAPNIKASDKTVFLGDVESVDYLSYITVEDVVDGVITPTVVVKNEAGEEVTEISGLVAGIYTVEVSAVDKAGNEATKTFTITVKEKPTGSYVMTNGDEKKAIADGGWIEWHDQGWVGSTVTMEATVSDKEVKVNYTMEGNNWFGVQLFYQDASITDETITATLKINSSVAGAIQILGQEFNLVVGDNEISAEAAKAADKATFYMQFGTASSNQAIPAGEFVISDLTINGKKVLAAADEIEMVNGSQDKAVAEGGWFEWHDQNWCGSTVTQQSTISTNGIKLFFEMEGNCWYGMQLFYHNPEITGETVTVVMKIRTEAACAVTVLSQVFELEAGENTITLEHTPVAGKAIFAMSFGDSSTKTAHPGYYVISELTINGVDLFADVAA